MQKRVLVFSESFGLGHERAANALIMGINTISDNFNILHTNSIRNSFPILTNAFLKLYMQIINNVPRVWHRFYESGRNNTNSLGTKNVVYNLLGRSIKKIIRDYKPHVIVCTHPFPAAVVSRFKEQGLDVPLVGIVTDYDIHGYWLNNQIDLYIVGDRKLNNFELFSSQSLAVSPSGIPIDPAFGKKLDKKQAKRSLALDRERPVVLVAGGGWGLGNLGKISELIARIPENPQIVVIAGTNYKLHRILKETLAGLPNVIVKGFVNNMHDYMLAADVMVTKPGGLTTSEGLAAGLPMVLFDVIYGQEVWNAKFLTESGAAKRIGGIGEIPEIVRAVITDHQESKRLSQNALVIGKPEAGIVAAEKIVNLAVG